MNNAWRAKITKIVIWFFNQMLCLSQINLKFPINTSLKQRSKLLNYDIQTYLESKVLFEVKK